MMSQMEATLTPASTTPPRFKDSEIQTEPEANSNTTTRGAAFIYAYPFNGDNIFLSY